MAEKRRYLDVWIVETNTVYREVPFEVVTDWVQQGRLLADDMLRRPAPRSGSASATTPPSPPTCRSPILMPPTTRPRRWSQSPSISPGNAGRKTKTTTST